MTRKWLVVLLLGILLVTSVAPPAASARAEDLNASLTIVYIDPQANVREIPGGPAGDVLGGALRWLVKDRSLTGVLAGDINGTVVFVNSGNLDVNQDGRMHGTFTIYGHGGAGTISGASTVSLAAGIPSPYDITYLLPYLPPDYAAYLGYLLSQGYTFASLPINGSGRMVMQQGTGIFAGFNGNARFSGVMVNALLAISPTGESHVVGMLPSDPIPVTGKRS